MFNQDFRLTPQDLTITTLPQSLPATNIVARANGMTTPLTICGTLLERSMFMPVTPGCCIIHQQRVSCWRFLFWTLNIPGMAATHLEAHYSLYEEYKNWSRGWCSARATSRVARILIWSLSTQEAKWSANICHNLCRTVFELRRGCTDMTQKKHLVVETLTARYTSLGYY